jgi:hypothetical protein
MMVTGSRPTYRPDVEGHAVEKAQTTVYEVFLVDGARLQTTTDKRIALAFKATGLLVLVGGVRL